MEDIFANYLIDDFHSERPQSLENDCLYVHVLLFIKNDTNKQKKMEGDVGITMPKSIQTKHRNGRYVIKAGCRALT